MKHEDFQKDWVKTLGLFGMIVSDFVVLVGGGSAAGYFLVKKFGYPWITVVLGGLLGLIGVFYHLYRFYTQKFDQSQD